MDKNVEKKTDNIDNTNNLVELSHEEKVKRAEIKLISFFVEHDIDFHVAHELISLMKNICIDSKIMQDLLPDQAKCTENIVKVLPKREDEKIMNQCLQSCRFSILVHEIYANNINRSYVVLIVLVRYVSPLNKKIVVQLFMHLVTPYSANDSNRSELFENFKYVLELKKIPIKNIVGLAYDNFYSSMSSVMVGSNSFIQHLKQEVPELITLNCICHSFTLVATKACKKLPETCEFLMHNIFIYTLNSAERCALLDDIQKLFNLEKKLHFPWIVLQNCVIKIVENWEDLKNYFAVIEDNSVAKLISSQLNDNIIKAYFLFLKYVLNLFNSFNAVFQSSRILVQKLFESSQQIICQLVQNFMTTHVLTHINDLDVNNEEHILNLEDIYLGPQCEYFLKTLPSPDRQGIKLTGLKFYKEATQELLKRLPYKNLLVEYLTFLEPEIALYNDKARIKFRDLKYIVCRTAGHNIDITKLAYEWIILPSMFDEQQKEDLACLEIDEMWSKIVECKNSNGEKVFPNLELLVKIVLSFPYSNAEAEQIFSDSEKCWL